MKKKIIALLLAAGMALSLCACGHDTSTKAPAETPQVSSPQTTKASSSTSSKSTASFTNQYGTSTTKCAHSGCDNYIASSGDTNCCTVHSNRCLECSKYIDGDAMYCMDCLTKAATKNSSSKSSTSSSSKSSSSGNSTSGTTGAGGYEMPNENDKSFSDYVKRVAPDLYDEMNDTYDGLFD